MSKRYAVTLAIGDTRAVFTVPTVNDGKAREIALALVHGGATVESVSELPKEKKVKVPTSRPERWNAAASDARAAYEAMTAARGSWEDAMGELSSLKEEYEEWHGNLPENLQGSALSDKLETITGMDFDVLPDLDECESLLDEIEGVELPLGFGRD